MPHIHELIDFTAEVFIVNDGKVLLRKHDKYKKWLSVGGHIELHEDPVQAALREAREESGLEIELIGEIKNKRHDDLYKELLPPRYMNRHRINEKHQHVTLVYFGKSKSNAVRPTGDDVSLEYKWFTKEELDKNNEGIESQIVFYALEALKAAEK